MWHSGSCIFPQTVDPPVFHTFGWQKDASFPIRNSIFSIHAWVSTNSRLLIPRLRYVVRNFRKKERQCMAMNLILLRTERHASWYFSIQTRSEISSNKMRNVSLERDYTLPWCWLSQIMKRNLTPTWEPTSCEVWVNALACRMVSDGTKPVGILRRISLLQRLRRSLLIFRRRWIYGPPGFLTTRRQRPLHPIDSWSIVLQLVGSCLFAWLPCRYMVTC